MIKNRGREPGRDVKIRCDRMLRMKDSAEHSRCTCVHGPSRSADEQLHNNAPHRKCLQKKTTVCVSLFVFFPIRRGTFPYSIEDDASTTSQTPTIHYTNTCVKLTIVIDLSFSERIAIANLPLNCTQARNPALSSESFYATRIDPPKGGSMILVTKISDQGRQRGHTLSTCTILT